ncbi:MAG: polysaccharide pyruvyl transferase family protein [Lachnospiraceae bacterium]|nr:polysaccharide pyruvyl transferase family protein [Lachnospiraceae bacterium]
MKYANLILDSDKGMENIGDWAQVFAIENLYKYMHVNYEDVIRIKISELSTYDGEYVILPINYPFYGYYNLSPKIIPVFLGISIIHKSVVKGLRMENFQPVGCRDYHTWKELTDYGLDAYISGCLTIALPKREKDPNQQKTFIVDVSDNVYEKIPSSIKNSAERLSHVYYLDECKGEAGARAIYERYKKEAALVITSRIHCAQPCLAMGIPVIFICEICSFRYDVVRQYIQIYSLEMMDMIDWKPVAPDLEEHKKILLRNAAERVLEVKRRYENVCSIGEFYLKGDPIKKEVDSVWAFQRYISERWTKDEQFSYSIWGITQIAEVIYEWIRNEYPNARLDKVIDIARTDAFHGVQPQKLEGIQQCKSVVFVTAGSANSVAIEVFKKYNISNYVVCYNGMYIVNGVEYSY